MSLDLNEAELKLKKIEIIESQIKHLQREASQCGSVEYSEACHEKAQELIRMLNLNSLFQ